MFVSPTTRAILTRKLLTPRDMPRAVLYLAILLLLVAIYVASRRNRKPPPAVTREAFEDDEEGEDTSKTKSQAVQTDIGEEKPVAAAAAAEEAASPPAPRLNLFGQSVQIVEDIKAIKEDVAYIKDRVRRREPASYESFYGGQLY